MPAEVPAAHVLEGWRYRWGDGPIGEDGVPAWAKESGEGDGWLPMPALGTPEGRDGRRLLWISIPLPQGDWEHPSLYLGTVPNVFELYSDGALLYRSGELDPEGYESAAHSDWHLVRLPAKALGRRVLLRIQSSGASIGVRQDVLLGEQDALFKRAVCRSMGPFVLGVILLALGTLAAVGFLARARDRPARGARDVRAQHGRDRDVHERRSPRALGGRAPRVPADARRGVLRPSVAVVVRRRDHPRGPAALVHAGRARLPRRGGASHAAHAHRARRAAARVSGLHAVDRGERARPDRHHLAGGRARQRGRADLRRGVGGAVPGLRRVGAELRSRCSTRSASCCTGACSG